MTYNAFLSYSHAVDGQLALAIQQSSSGNSCELAIHQQLYAWLRSRQSAEALSASDIPRKRGSGNSPCLVAKPRVICRPLGSRGQRFTSGSVPSRSLTAFCNFCLQITTFASAA